MTTVNEANTYKTLDVTLAFDGDRVKVVWYVEGEARAREPYHVARAPLEDARTAIRAALDDLQTLDWHIARHGRHTPSSWPLRRLPDGIEAKMAALAAAGRAQYAALFTGLPGKEDFDYYANEFRTWFEENVAGSTDPKWHLHFTHQDFSRSINPWGLTCAPGDTLADACAGAGAGDGVAALGFDNFWCSSLRLSCSTAASKQAFQQEAPVTLGVEVIGVFENDDGTLDRLINEYRHESDNAKRALGLDWRHVTRSVGRMQDQDKFFYFSLSADPDQPGAYRQSGATLTPARFHQDVLDDLSERKRPSFIFLDGDAIVRHDRGGEWVSEALNCGRAGLIAVETDIENPDLRHFGWNIARDVWLSRVDLLDGVQAARRKFWPLSLLYGLYSDPHIALIDPPPEDSIRVIDLYITKLNNASSEEPS